MTRVIPLKRLQSFEATLGSLFNYPVRELALDGVLHSPTRLAVWLVIQRNPKIIAPIQ